MDKQIHDDLYQLLSDIFNTNKTRVPKSLIEKLVTIIDDTYTDRGYILPITRAIMTTDDHV